MKKSKKLFRRLAAIGMSTALLFGGAFVLPQITDTAVTAQAATAGITLDKTSFSLGKGESLRINVKSGKVSAWTSSNNAIAVVNGGLVTGKKNGTAVITAKTSDGKTAKCTVTVKNAPSKITITKGILTLGAGESFTLSSYVNDGSASANRNYRTSNPSVVKMTNTKWTGSFTAVKPGIAYVTVRTFNGKESACKVTVKAAPSKVTLNRGLLSLKVGQSASLSASIPANTGCAKRIYRTSNPKVVKMTKTEWTGNFTAVAPGTAYVTVRTYNGKEASCKVVVASNTPVQSGYAKLVSKMKADKAHYDSESDQVMVMVENLDQAAQKGSGYGISYDIENDILQFVGTEARLDGDNVYMIIMALDNKKKSYGMFFTWMVVTEQGGDTNKGVMMAAEGKTASLTKSAVIPFEATDMGMGTDLTQTYDKTMLSKGKTVGNTKAKAYMAQWDSILYKTYGMHMNEIGFTNWK